MKLKSSQWKENDEEGIFDSHGGGFLEDRFCLYVQKSDNKFHDVFFSFA